MGWDPGPRTSMQSITGLYTWKTLPLPYVWTFLAFTCSHDDKSKVLLRHDGHYICVEILAIHSSLCWTLMVNGYIGTVLTKFWFVVAAACLGTNREKLLIRHRGCMYRQYKWTCSWMGNFLLWPKYMKHIFNRMLGSLSEPRALYHCNYLHPEILYPKQLGLLLPVVAPILNCTRVRLETLVRSIFCSDWYIRCIKYWTQFFVVFQVLGDWRPFSGPSSSHTSPAGGSVPASCGPRTCGSSTPSRRRPCPLAHAELAGWLLTK